MSLLPVWDGWTAFFTEAARLIGNAFVSYLITKHFIKGVYVKHVEKRFKRRRKQ